MEENDVEPESFYHQLETIEQKLKRLVFLAEDQSGLLSEEDQKQLWEYAEGIAHIAYWAREEDRPVEFEDEDEEEGAGGSL